MILAYPEVEGIEIKDILTHPLRSKGANALHLRG